MFDALFEGFILVFQWPAIGFVFLGVLIGIWLGAVPGLSGIIGLVLLLPFTFEMEPVSAFALLLSMYAVTSTSDTIASVMLGIPGTAASQATILDGYPLAQKGQAARAFGAAFTVSAFGGVFGAIILALSLPIILPIILAFGSPELFMLGMLGLTMVGSLSGGSILKGLTVAMLGLFMSSIGYDETEGVPRYWFGINYLLDGVPIIPVVLGLFAIPELMELAIKDICISRIPKEQAEHSGIMDGVKDAFKNWWLVLRCSLIGTYVGMLPGLGASIVDWVAYGHAVQSAKDKSQFGKGDIRGVIAPEAANNATRGGALIPTVAFGIPGNLATSILLGALVIQGLRPGPEMLTTNLHITFSMVWTIVVANILVSIMLMFWCKQVAKIIFLPGHLIVPGVILFVFMGAWLGGTSIGDWVTCLSMGIVGFIMKRGGWPRPPFILAFILGNILENTLTINMKIHQGIGWLSRPIVLVIMALILFTVFLSVKGFIKSKADKEVPGKGEGSERNPVISFLFTILLVIVFLWSGIESLQWSAYVKQFPLTAIVFAITFLLFILYFDARELVQVSNEAGGMKKAFSAASEKAVLPKAFQFFGYITCVILVTLVVGQKITLPLFIVIYLRRWGGYGWRLSLGYAVCGWVFLVGFYDRIMHMFWHPPWLSAWISSVIPAWLPEWLII